MCGIVGFAKQNCINDIYKCLKLLDYRGYDSVGVAYNNIDSTFIVKQKGKVEEIFSLIKNIDTNIGIGHTRWATHGKPSETNAHPHKCGLFTIVHNGIIENADFLRRELIKKGYLFLSETDSEVVAVLLQDYFEPDNVLSGIQKAVKQLTGTYALAILCEYSVDTVYLVKKENPLIIGKGENFFCFASDTPALVGYAQSIYRMRDYEFATIKENSVSLFDKNLKEIPIDFKKSDITQDNIDKGLFPTYMLKEIFEIPESVKQTIEYLKKLTLPVFRYNSIYIVGCGTAFHAGLYAKGLIERLLKTTAFCIPSDEFVVSDIEIDENDLIIAISQSGETADTICAVKNAKKNHAKVIAVTNVASSTIATLGDFTVATKAGVEIAVGATKSYATQLVALKYVVNSIAGLPNTVDYNLSEYIAKMLDYNDYIKTFAFERTFENLFFMGLGSDYPSALEGSLKAKEISLFYSDACHSGEIKHGPLAMVSDKTLVICIVTKEKYLKTSLNAINEVKSRGATVLAISCFENTSENEIIIPKCDEDDRSILSVIPMQLLSYYLAIKRNLDPDKPRNLAKSVTVG